MSVKLINMTWWDRFIQGLFGYRNFQVPTGDLVNCYKDRSLAQAASGRAIPKWGNNRTTTIRLDPGYVGPDGVGMDTPIQLGRAETRKVTYGSGYGRVQQLWGTIPLPLGESRYWVTGYPNPMYDVRCIIMEPSGKVHELIQFDQDAPVRMAGLPQQALDWGAWSNGVLVEGVATTASGLPNHAYIWGRGSIENPHCQSFTVQDYLGGDGTAEFAKKYPDAVRCGERFYLPKESLSYKNMVAKGGQCRARAEAAANFGLVLIDRGGQTAMVTQAGTWARGTNIHEFTLDLQDLRYAIT